MSELSTRRFKDITGMRFGRLLAVNYAGPTERGTATWRCLCDCGKIITVQGSHLRSGGTRSCGCVKQEMLKNGSGHCRHRASPHHNRMREYECWVSMRQRCGNRNSKSFAYYGGRGITVCERWHSFESFLADMGPRPDGYSIERVNNNGDYEPSNCKWIPKRDQSRNRRKETRPRKPQRQLQETA
jgi:hypothetical protein